MRTGLLQTLTALIVLCVPLPAALAQSHVTESGGYTLKASVVPSSQISSEMATEYGITVAGDRGILTVVVLQADARAARPVSAKVSAIRTDLVGRAETIEMREMRVNEGVSYIGGFSVDSASMSRFRVEVLPAGATEPLSVEFQERFFVPR